MLICVMTGLASCMPLYVLFQLVPAWLRAAEVSLAEIGLFALVGLPYTWKFLWAPLMDRIRLGLGLWVRLHHNRRIGLWEVSVSSLWLAGGVSAPHDSKTY